MGKRGIFFFAIAATIMVAIIWGNPVTRIQAAFFPDIQAVLPTAQSLESLDLAVDPSQLQSHVSAVSTIRFAPEEKEPVRNYIEQALTDYGLTPIEQPYSHPGTGIAETGGINIMAELPGSDATTGSFVLGAHYDSHQGSPGADDNGSAIASLLETARLLSTASSIQPFPTGIKFVFFDQEERQLDGSGLLGSIAFTADARNIDNVRGAVILDMVGYACRTAGCQSYPERLPVQDLPDTGDFLAVLGLSDHTELLGAFMGSAQTTWPSIFTLPIPQASLRLFPDLLRSDHAPFWEKGIPATFVTDTANFRSPYYHTAEDLPETLDPSFLRGCAQHVVNVMATLISQSTEPSSNS